jgi:hypothetical protein
MGRQDAALQGARRPGHSGPADLPPAARKNLPLVVLVHGGPYVRGSAWGWNRTASSSPRAATPCWSRSSAAAPASAQALPRRLEAMGPGHAGRHRRRRRWAIAQGIADPKRICIAGASYGGYATLMGLVNDPRPVQVRRQLGRRHRHQPAVRRHWSFTSDMTDEWKQYGMPEMIGDPVKDAAQLKATSPIEQAARIKQPLLMAYGGADQRVPIYHGTQVLRRRQAHQPARRMDRIRGRRPRLGPAEEPHRLLEPGREIPRQEYRQGSNSAAKSMGVFVEALNNKGDAHVVGKNSGRTGRRPDRRHQPVAGRAWCWKRAASATSPGLRRPARRARHRQRRLPRPDPGNQPQPGTGGGHAVVGARLDPRQARHRLLPARSSRCCARTRSSTSSTSAATIRPTRCASSARKRKRPAIRCAASTSPRPSTTTWSATTTRRAFPSAARFVAQAFAGANLDNAAAAGRVCGRGDGPPCRLPDRRLAAGQEVPGRRPAPDLPARAHCSCWSSSWPTSRPPTRATAAA